MSIDSDGDGQPDDCDLCEGGDDAIDSDGDSIPDFCDRCPGFNDFNDADGDGIPDGCEIDTGTGTSTGTTTTTTTTDDNVPPLDTGDLGLEGKDEAPPIFHCGCNASGPASGWLALMLTAWIGTRRRRPGE